jgi:hypothetical protein
MSSLSPQHRPLRFVDQVDPGNRPEADAALDAALDRAIQDVSPARPAAGSGMTIEEARVRLEGHLSRLDAFQRRLGDLDPERKGAEAVELLKDLERDLARAASPCELQTSALPLLSLGQGAYRRVIKGDPATGRLDIRA